MKQTCFLVLLLSIGPYRLHAQVPDSLLRIFEYDSTQQVEIKIVSEFDYTFNDVPLKLVTSPAKSGSHHVRVSSVTYRSKNQFSVSAWITAPISADSLMERPVAIFQHWGEGNKDEFLSEAILLSKKGFICLLPDAPNHCPGTPFPSKSEDVFEIFRYGVVNVRCGINLLFQNYNVNRSKIIFTGHSYGAGVGAILSGIEPRISAYILMTGLPSFSKALQDESDARLVSYRQRHPKEFDDHVRLMQPLDAELYIAHKKVPVYLQLATRDEYIPLKFSRQYEQLVPAPKKVTYYQATHDLNEAASKDRRTFIDNFIIR
ncbi:MAG TPA: alpha/beta fold hydrolase [Chryseosolibacter sp.]